MVSSVWTDLTKEERMTLTDELFDKYVKLIYRKTGIYYEYGKKYFVHKRIEKCAANRGIDSLNDYYGMLKFSTDAAELDLLINELTINETYYFRDFPQLRNFAEEVLPIVDEKRQRKRKIKIWCAACSTGEEAYTLAIILREMLEEYEKWDVEIFASDINTEVLNYAKTGLYDDRAIRDVPKIYLEKYFTMHNGKYLVNTEIRNPITFGRINLMDEEQMRSVSYCDFIFCRNCLIYFDDESRKSVVSRFYNALRPGGILFLGHSESVARISSAFESRKIGDTIIYSKP